MNTQPASAVVYRVLLYDAYDAFTPPKGDYSKIGTIDIQSDANGIKSFLLSERFSSRASAEAAQQTALKLGFSKARIITVP